MSTEKEIWQNSTAGTRFVLRFGHDGALNHEAVRAGQKVVLSPEERQVNMERAANDKLNVFKNGAFLPVKLVDGSEDAAEIASNPNLRSESELVDLFGLQWKRFEAEIGQIENGHALRRLAELAEEHDATVRQMKVIQDRINEIDPQAFAEVFSVGDVEESFTGRGVMPA